MNTVWMKPPDGGPPEEVEVDDRGLNISQKNVAHWTVCEPPATPLTKTRKPKEEDGNGS